MTSAAPQPAVRLEGVSKRFGATVALDRLSLSVVRGECVGVLGPSGCGKSTLLRIVAGLERVDAGVVELEGTRTDDPKRRVPPEDRNVGLVFQEQALWPHMDVADNLNFVLDARGVSKADGREAKAHAAAEAAGFPLELLSRRPGELSGGERQRAAVARALVQEPAVLLLDEPLTGMDRDLRYQLIATLRRLRAERGLTTLLVTHDQREAFALADRVVVLKAGRVEQEGPPEEVYTRPVSQFVAEFVGLASCLPVRRDDGRLMTPLGTWPADGVPDGPVLAVFRPEDLRLSPGGEPNAKVRDVYYQGDHWMHVVELDDDGVEVVLRSAEAHAPGSALALESSCPAYVPAGSGS